MKATTFAWLESKFRILLTKGSPEKVVRRYSEGRIEFLEKLKNEKVRKPFVPHEGLSRVLWGIKFRSYLMNAAGMFKNGECYELVEKQGAGGYLGGTGTWNSREGNRKDGIILPFVPYPKSNAASNWLGLPNDGDQINAVRAGLIEKVEGCPVGWSIMGSPDFESDED
jgi:dihydroorotate dehydrogenase